MDTDCGTVIIGAGVIGLAIADALSHEERELYILEKGPTHGRGVSSRNSEVIHAGIYYPADSLKAKFCVEGGALLYETCEKQKIPHQKIGKLIIATTDGECTTLEELKVNAERNGVASITLLGKNDIRALEPHIAAIAGLHSPDTGIVSVHHLMDYYLHSAKQRGADIVYGTTVREIERVPGGYRIGTIGPDGERFAVRSERVINAAGLHADEVAAMTGASYVQHYCKGDYFSIRNVKKGMVQRLVYPVPEADHVGLGVHLTLDLNGRMRLGPDATYIDRAEQYRVDERKGDAFFEAAVKFLPFIRREDVVPDMSGIRPKLQAPGEGFRDFVISEDLPGFINLVGIESPGLTSAPAIARFVRSMLACRPMNV